MKTASYTMLTKTNTWGLRIEGTVKVGDTVTAYRRGQKKGQRKVVTAIVWTGNGVTLASMEDAPKAKLAFDGFDAEDDLTAANPRRFDCDPETRDGEDDLPY